MGRNYFTVRPGSGAGGSIFLLLPFLFLVTVFYFPLSLILIYSFSGSSLSRFLEILTSSYYLRVIGFTIFQAAISTLFAVFLALPGAYIMSHFTFPGKKVIKALTTIPFVLPSILVVLGFVIFFGNNGVLNSFLKSIFNLDEPPLKILYSLKAIILAHGFYNFPIAIQVISGVWEKIGSDIRLAAEGLGAGRIRAFLTITLPQLLPGIMTAAALIFLFCFMSFAVILVLGGGPQFTTVEVEVYRLARIGVDLEGAGGLAIISSVLSLLFLYFYLRLQDRYSFAEDMQLSAAKVKRFTASPPVVRLLLILYLLVILTLIIAPLLSVVARSFTARVRWSGITSFSLKSYAQVFQEGSVSLLAIWNSVRYALATVLIAVPLGSFSAYVIVRSRGEFVRILESLIMLPMGISSIILGLGYLRLLNILPWEIKGGRLIIISAHAAIAFPFVLRSVKAVMKKIDMTLVDAGRSLGATPLRIFRTIEFPLLKSGILTGGAFAFAISMGEVQATMILADREGINIPIAMYRFIGAYNFFAACALGTLLMVLCFLAFLMIEHFRYGSEMGSEIKENSRNESEV